MSTRRKSPLDLTKQTIAEFAAEIVDELCDMIKWHKSDLDIEAAYKLVADAIASRRASAPMPIRLPCPMCSELHIDEGEFATKPHHTHACQHCGHVWRPAVEHTVGVRFLPGFRTEPLVKMKAIRCP